MHQHCFVGLLLVLAAKAGGRQRCGGVLTAARGILTTPRFPADLPTPLRCEWVIDSTHVATTPNTSIVVYLTQLYVHEGLTFTEYQVYDRTYQLDGRVLHRVNETNVAQVRWVQSFQNYLVVTLQLESVDSAHLRVLDRLLDVYGFNITYEIARGAARADSCTMMDCGFTGICYDHYTKFGCDCFPGYTGASCSSGPSSFCGTSGAATCQNGGTCIHVGVSAVKCQCLKGYVGDTCQTPLASLKAIDCENCVVSCPFDGRLENACKCTNGATNATNTDRIGFTCTMHLSNLPNLSGDPLKNFIENQIYKTLRVNYSKLEEVKVENVAYFRSGADVTFHLFAARKTDEKRIRTILNKWADRGYIANLTVADKEFVFGPLLDLQSVSINHLGVIRQGDEFILACVARGSPSMSFRWLKDGLFVNITEVTSHKWSRLIKDPHLDDQYTALLGVDSADILDAGTFTCQVEDFQIQQCLSRKVSIKAPPLIKVEPMSLTVQKGDNFTIKCISMASPGGKYTYSWTKNRELIPVRSPTEKYEILYPSGSILQVFRIDKPAKFSCLVQDDAISTEIMVDVRVLDARLIRTCAADTFLNVSWPETAPHTDCLQDCPKGYVFPGFVRRTCSLNDGLTPAWNMPDYADCTSAELRRIRTDLDLLRLGYETAAPAAILDDCRRYLRSRSLLPGEGSRILDLIRDTLALAHRLRSYPLHVPATVFDLIDGVLRQPHALINQPQVKLLQEVVNQQIALSIRFVENTKLLDVTRSTIDVRFIPEQDDIELSFASKSASSQQVNRWVPGRIVVYTVEKGGFGGGALAFVIYRNLTDLLPVRSVIRLKDGAEVEYEIISQIFRAWADNNAPERYMQQTVWKVEHEWNTTSRDGWYLRCAMAEMALYAYAWNTSACRTTVVNASAVHCQCPGSGTFALLYTTSNIQVEKESPRPRRYIVLAGCSLCFLAGLLCSVVLTAHWLLKRSCIVFLKLQCSISVTGVMLTIVLVTVGDPPERLFANVMALLETLLLMSMSAHVSTLLMVYTELVYLPKQASKQTVIGISTGVPVIAVFGNHLAHRTMDVRLRSWWLLAGTLAFHIFVTVSAVIVALFLLLYFTVVGKLKGLMAVHEKDGKILKKRIVLLKRSALVFVAVVVVSGSSIAYINYSDVIWWHYEFSIVTMLLGLILIISYVIKSETEFYYLFHTKFRKSKQKENFFGVESTGSPLNFFTREDAEVESESMPHRKSSSSQPSKPIECFQMTDTCKSTLPECVSGTMESSSSSSTYVDAIYCAQTSLRKDSIERYNRSPQAYRKTITFKIDEENRTAKEPDVIATKRCHELDLVASHAPSIIVTPEDSISVILQQAGGWKKRPQPDGREIGEVVLEKVDTDGDKLDGMLERIGHDLDYLLDRSSEEVVVSVAGVGVRKSLVEEVIVEEAEEDVKVPEAITDILRTSC